MQSRFIAFSHLLFYYSNFRCLLIQWTKWNVFIDTGSSSLWSIEVSLSLSFSFRAATKENVINFHEQTQNRRTYAPAHNHVQLHWTIRLPSFFWMCIFNGVVGRCLTRCHTKHNLQLHLIAIIVWHDWLLWSASERAYEQKPI